MPYVYIRPKRNVETMIKLKATFPQKKLTEFGHYVFKKANEAAEKWLEENDFL